MVGLIVGVQEVFKLVLCIATPFVVAQGIEVIKAGGAVVAPNLYGFAPLLLRNVEQLERSSECVAIAYQGAL